MRLSYVNIATKNLITADKTEYAYRDIGRETTTPIIALNHLSGNLDNWDPEIIDGLAQEHRVITFDYKGVGQTSGKVANSIKKMAEDTLQFIQALEFDKVILFGFSMGGMVAQELVMLKPEIVDKLILAGTGPRGGVGIDQVTKISDQSLVKAIFTGQDVKTYLFFTRTDNGKSKAKEFVQRLHIRTKNRDKTISWLAYRRQLKAIHKWGLMSKADLSKIGQDTLIVNGDDDIMVPTEPNTYELHDKIKNSSLIVYPDAGHGSIGQFPNEFVKAVNTFLLSKLFNIRIVLIINKSM